MTSLFICIITSTLIGFIFKMYPRLGVNTFHAIVFNYFVCVIMAWITLGEFPIQQDFHKSVYFPYAVFLGILFIGTFNLTALTIQKFGVTLTTIMQKMSLMFTVPIAIWLYNENINFFKIAGLIAGLFAIWLTNQPGEEDYQNVKKLPRWMLVLPTAVLLASVFMEVTLQYVQEKVLGSSGDPKFVATLFLIAGLVGLLVIAGKFIFHAFSGQEKKSYFSSKKSFINIAAGIILGIPNFYSIYLILKTIGDGMDGSVFFPINNVSIIALSAFVAYLFFNEKLSKANIVGVLLSLVAVFLIGWGFE